MAHENAEQEKRCGLADRRGGGCIDLDYVRRDLDAIMETIYGNGKPGMKETLHELVIELHAMREERQAEKAERAQRKRDRVELGWQTRLMLGGALLAFLFDIVKGWL